MAPTWGHAVRNRNGVTRVTAKAARETIVFFLRILGADMDLESAQANDGEIQTDKKWEREGKSETERHDERHNGAI